MEETTISVNQPERYDLSVDDNNRTRPSLENGDNSPIELLNANA